MRARHLVLLLCLLGVVMVVVPVVFMTVLVAVQPAVGQSSPSRAGVAVARLPPLARSMLPLVTTRVSERCPELSVVRVLAEVQAESGWNPRAWSADVNGGAAGLLQINQANWVGLGGQSWPSSPPPAEADIFDASTHLTLGIDFLCTNLRAMAEYLQQSGKATDPLDAMSICHIAGCSRVTGSRTGIPVAGEAGCGARCTSLIRRYISNIHRYESEWMSTPKIGGSEGTVPPGVDLDQLSAPTPYVGGPTGCTEPDPTTSGCLTAATANGVGEIQRTFESQIRSAGCWAPRPWNPTSDHPKGRGCDLFPDRSGIFPSGEQLDAGWRIAAWLRVHAEALRVKYVIWQGRYWDPTTGDRGGWGEPYTGGGVYDAKDATGGHYDHIHVSFKE
ncbi:lytic transglycosylase domain-containing protein [Amycolatopsis palatopharyngis]|uniref:lytic transglycosylase domain-containing protein n=1 Tax=Amycolatopsis palatopharyngis TaxID=187982 RepID=UPI000E23E4B7|nr:lytic transglycosylase domain-containing protein [Amycolatopsis palatopharyngis]